MAVVNHECHERVPGVPVTDPGPLIERLFIGFYFSGSAFITLTQVCCESVCSSVLHASFGG